MKKSRLLAKTVLLAWLFVLTTNVAQAAVILLNESRAVHVLANAMASTGSDNAETTRNSLNDFTDFDELVAVDLAVGGASASGSAMQMSQFTPTSLSATGVATASAEADPFFEQASVRADTFFSVNFEVTTAQLFNLSGAISVSSSALRAPGLVDFGLSGPGFNLNFSAFDHLTIPFNESGTLLPGFYTLGALALMTASGFEASSGIAEFSIDLNLTEVPIPPALYLFGSGLLGLIGVARRKTA